ncbi:MBL fold metallo-hydrolase [Qingshengfaniella alkalisoli]|uniref:MBL fold metallo-hydrolase n=1 Tax=Qingshengfaniella alkalisoli TaxID=2599296 RepID=A0A5B8I5A6_9RHOB|nr:MBL fold metallo-hydrolase [Qingshengfaniella alkalisoli]QDY68479.1 MBL fold metallo-hydrolase [Qingshengfaniella alkalisoli]
MATLRFTILGCGSSGGVPRLGGIWGDCDPKNPKNRRTRCSMLIERIDGEAATRVLVDTSPDMRAQLLAADVGTLDAVVYTHSHADHVHGIDDLRMIVFNLEHRLRVHADEATCDNLMTRFGYAFVQPAGSNYPPILDMSLITGEFSVSGAGGEITIHPIEITHGHIHALGLRVNGLVYMPDVSAIPEDTWAELKDMDCWVLDALRRRPHSSHVHLARSLEWIRRAAPRRAVLTNMHVDLDYDTVCDETPEHVEPAFDGMTIEYEV